MNIHNKIKEVSKLIGNTPMLEINFKFKGEKRRLYTKLEYYNLTGSIKDRVALYILGKAVKNGTLTNDNIIVEATSGNTGIAIAAMGRVLGNKVIIYMPDWMSDERKNIIKAFGADIRLVSKEENGFVGSIKMTEELAKKDGKIFLTAQFSNRDNIETHYNTTAVEIWSTLEKHHIIPDGFVAGVGTGGTVMGVGKYLKEKNPNAKVYPVEPASSPTMSTGYKVGEHRIQGISDEFVPDLIDLNFLDDIIAVDDGDAIIMAQKLAKELGLAVGISSGANFIGAVKAQENRSGIIVTVFADDNKKYLSTDLMKVETVKDSYISKDIELLNIRVLE